MQGLTPLVQVWFHSLGLDMQDLLTKGKLIA
jgi:hypothetical protein